MALQGYDPLTAIQIGLNSCKHDKVSENTQTPPYHERGCELLRNEKKPVRKDDFKRWLEHQESDDKTVRNNVSQAQRVERAYGRSLDDLYKQDELQRVLTELRYSTEDKRNGVANPSKVAIDGDLYSNLQSIRTAVTKYRKFCEAEHSDSLPRRRWGKFLDAAKQLIEEGELDRDEGYKDQLARSLAQVRTAFLKDDENWPTRLKAVIQDKDNNLIHWPNKQTIARILHECS